MKDLELKIYPAKSLRKEASPVTTFDAALQAQIDEMFSALKHLHYWALSAPEIGLTQRIAVLELPISYLDCSTNNEEFINLEEDLPEEPKQSLCLINPHVVEKAGQITSVEGCLSFYGLQLQIPRAKQIKVQYQDPQGNEQFLTVKDAAACMIQHQIDHLNGILFIDYFSNLKRNMILKKWEKAVAQLIANQGHCHDHTCGHAH